MITVSGYTTQEKLEICKRYLVPRQLEQQGLKKLKLDVNHKALLKIIESYTRESGVRNLEREVGSLFRKLARIYVEKGEISKKVTASTVTKLLGTERYDQEINNQEDEVGLTRGLAWTMYGGEVLPIEVSLAPGRGQLTLTGRLGDVTVSYTHLTLPTILLV